MENLRLQIEENQKILESHSEDNDDMKEKIQTQRDTVTRRDNEIIELRDRITFSSN
jgi:hypothetical protein